MNHEQLNNGAGFLVVLIGTFHGLTFNNWVSLGVLITGFITMIINWRYKHKNFELAKQKLAHELQKSASHNAQQVTNQE